jgi:hypothetical protein
LTYIKVSLSDLLMATMAAMTPVEDMGGPRTVLNDAQERKILSNSREADWAIGGAAIGFTAPLVEFIANNVFEKSNHFSSRKGEIRPVPRKNKRRQKFKDILEEADVFVPRNDFGDDDYDITYRNILQEHYIGNDDVYDYEDYSNTQFPKPTFPPEIFDLKSDLKKPNVKDVNTTRSPGKMRKYSTTTRQPRRKQKQQRKSSTSSPISQNIPRSEYLPDSYEENLLSDSYSLPNISKPKVINKNSIVKKTKDTSQRRYHRGPQEADLLRRVSSEYEQQKKVEKQEAMFN